MPPTLRISTEFKHSNQGPYSAPLIFNPNISNSDRQAHPLSALVQSNDNSNLLPSIKSEQGQMTFVYDSQETLKEHLNREPAVPKKKRYKPTPQQVVYLMDAFERDPLPSTAARVELSERIDMRPRAIQIWFQNRRAKVKSMERERKSMLEFVDGKSPIVEEKHSNEIHHTVPSFHKSNGSNVDQYDDRQSLQYRQARANAQHIALTGSLFMKSNHQMSASLPSPMPSPLNTLIQLQALQQAFQANWLSSQNEASQFSAPLRPLLTSSTSSIVGHELSGYSAEELLKLLEM